VSDMGAQARYRLCFVKDGECVAMACSFKCAIVRADEFYLGVSSVDRRPPSKVLTL
jgi:hypothetical protein